MEPHRPVIALLTDFGTEDAYVGVVKSVISGRCDARIVDISHAVPPQNIRHAAYLLWTAYKYLPDGAIVLCVVDPGVGTDRRPIAVRWPRGFFVGPDNGWLSFVVRDALAMGTGVTRSNLPESWTVVELDQPKFWLNPVSKTFHGRDIFAPVAAALSSGVPIQEVGSARSSLTVIDSTGVRTEDGVVKGRVIHIDHFGNLITDIPEAFLPDRFTVRLGGGTVDGPAGSYQSPDPLIAVMGSSGNLEIAAPNANAARLIMVGVGDAVDVMPRA